MTDAPAIALSGLSKRFGPRLAVDGLDLQVQRGEIMGFLGPNGAGKSTTMRMLLGLIAPSAGTATVLGFDAVRDSLAVRERVGYLAGDFELYPQLTGAAVLEHLARLRGGVDRGRIAELAERFGADLSRPTRELSTGNRQKLGLIQAFMHAPSVLVLDEPIAGLDPLVQRSFHELLGDVRAAGGTVFLSSHTLSEVDRVADRVAVLRDGRLVVVDALDHLRVIAVRRWEVELAGPVDPEAIRRAPGVQAIEVHGPRLLISFAGAPDGVLKALAAHDVRDLRVHDDDLEQIFLRFYAEDA